MGGDQTKEEGNVTFNDAVNAFNLRLYSIGTMVKDHRQWKRKHADATFILAPCEGFFMHHPTYTIAHSTDFVTPAVEQWLEREKNQMWGNFSKRLECGS